MKLCEVTGCESCPFDQAGKYPGYCDPRHNGDGTGLCDIEQYAGMEVDEIPPLLDESIQSFEMQLEKLKDL